MEPIKTRTADAFKMSLEAGELVIEFGNVVGPGQTPGPTAVAITDRVILPLDTGRRLVHSLEDCLKPHAAALRAEEAKALSPSKAAVVARPANGRRSCCAWSAISVFRTTTSARSRFVDKRCWRTGSC